MSSQQEKWDRQYAARPAATARDACTVLHHNLHLLPARGEALDLACGQGGNALLLAEQGLTVTACDISAVALETLTRSAAASGLTIKSWQRDIEHEGLGAEQYDVICVSRYLHRPLCADIAGALKPGGLLFYQTFCEEKPGESGPGNPAYILKTNELLSLFAELTLRFYAECGPLGDPARGNRSEALFVGQRQPR